MRLSLFDYEERFELARSVHAVSGDGSTIVGDGNPVGSTRTNHTPFRWTAESGLVDLEALSGGTVTVWAKGVSSDGSVIVGSGPVGDISEAVRWDPVNGTIALGHLGGPVQDQGSLAFAVNSDGSVIVGSSSSPKGGEAFRWTAETGMVGLGAFPNPFFGSRATDVSRDGTVVVGWSDIENDDGSGDNYPKAFRWTEEEGMVRISELYRSEATAVSGDGNIVIGASREGGFIWIEGLGSQLFVDYLISNFDFGFDLTGWKLAPNGISDDGTKIVGRGTDPNGNGEREPFLIDLAPQDPPAITTSPIEATVNTAGSTTLSVEASGEELTYQWQLNGVEIPGATESTYTIPSAQRYHGGDYVAIVANGGGSVASASASVTVAPPPSSDARLTNLSTRAMALSGNDVLIPGFVISGTGTKSLLIRAVGATLRKDPFNIATALEDPTMTLKQWDGSTFVDLASNDNWDTNANLTEIEAVSGAVGAFALSDSRDSVLLADLGEGQYTVIAGGVGDLTGVAIVELYDADDAGSGTVLANISNRGFVGTGASIMIPGISVSSEGPK
ncbi:MAG: hypothetical protein DRI65_17730, partial [Chloroflexota bacterium]